MQYPDPPLLAILAKENHIKTTCQKCSAQFFHKLDLEIHSEQCLQNKDLQVCFICGYHATRKSDVIRHVKFIHLKIPRSLAQFGPKKGTKRVENGKIKKVKDIHPPKMKNLESQKVKKQCKVCKKFLPKDDISAHQKQCSDVSETAYCNICKKSFSKKNFTRHQKIHGKENVSNDDKNKEGIRSWRKSLGNPPSPKTNVKEWILFQKQKWVWQRKQKLGPQKSEEIQNDTKDIDNNKRKAFGDLELSDPKRMKTVENSMIKKENRFLKKIISGWF